MIEQHSAQVKFQRHKGGEMDAVIETNIGRDPDYPTMIDFHVTAKAWPENFTDEQTVVANLRGVITHLPFLGWIDEIPIDYFDSRSAHSFDAYELVEGQTKKIAAALGLELKNATDFETLVFFEDADVAEEYRGSGLALRLFREIAYLLKNNHTLYVLKAHPTGSDLNVSDDDCRKLAAYYLSDQALAFKEVDPIDLPGWLVGQGSMEIEETNDSRYFDRKKN